MNFSGNKFQIIPHTIGKYAILILEYDVLEG